MTSSGGCPGCQLGSLVSSTRRKEAGIDTLPFVSTLCVLAPLNLRLTCLSFVVPSRPVPRNVKAAG